MTSDETIPTIESVVNRAAGADDDRPALRTTRGHGAEMRGLAHVASGPTTPGRFGRMFDLPPLALTLNRIRDIAEAMTEAGRAPAGDNPRIPSGYTYFGQFVDHDITFDPVSSLARQSDPEALTNFRTPRFDLDNVYGRGPSDEPFRYDQRPERLGRFLIGRHDGEDDLPRNDQKVALIADPRNDENIFVAAMQLTMLKFHNQVLKHVEEHPGLKTDEESSFGAAQRLARWHYQWAVVHDFLRRIVGNEMLDSILDESGNLPTVTLLHYQPGPGEAMMPVEFAVAAYRFGHSMIRGSYQLNSLVGPLPVFRPGSVDDDPLGHFGGFRELPAAWTIEWKRFFDVRGPASADLQQARLIDTRLADPLTQLPVEVAGDRPSLIVRNLLRGTRLTLPSGQAVAGAMGADLLSAADLDLPGGGAAPLWYYVLREAQVQAQGRHLGQVGGRIVAEVFLGLLRADPTSYLRMRPRFRPVLPSAEEDRFTVGDLITFSGHGLERVDG